jgi:hypothetical protein
VWLDVRFTIEVEKDITSPACLRGLYADPGGGLTLPIQRDKFFIKEGFNWLIGLERNEGSGNTGCRTNSQTT